VEWLQLPRRVLAHPTQIRTFLVGPNLPPFFYPQRFIICCLTSFLLLVVFAGIASLAIELLDRRLQDIRADVVDYTETIKGAILTIQDIEKKAIDPVEMALQGGTMGVVLRAALSKLADSRGVVPGDIASSSVSTLVAGATQTALLQIQKAVNSIPEILDVIGAIPKEFNRLRLIIVVSSTLGLVLSCIVSVGLWVFMARLFKQRLLAMRTGEYFFDRARFSQRSASRYIGFQVVASIGGFFLIWGVVALVGITLGVIFGFPFITRVVWKVMRPLIIGLLSVSFLLPLVSTYFVQVFLMRDGHVIHRRLYAAFDFLLTILNLASGVVSAIVRLPLSLVPSVALYARW